MAKRFVIRVQYKAKAWYLKSPVDSRNYPTQAAAIQDGREWARQRWFSGYPSQLVVHGKSGRILWESTFGRDPKRFPG